MEIIMYQVDAFTDQTFGGNPAGVIPDARGLDSQTMQRIARELNVSETAFITQKDETHFKVRFFTPTCEVDLCGHATVGAFYTLAYKGYIPALEEGYLTLYQETRAGELAVEIYFEAGQVDRIMMEQGVPKSLGLVEDRDRLAACLGIDPSKVGIEKYALKPEIMTTGLPDIILPVEDEKLLSDMTVHNEALIALSKELGVTGVHAFCITDDGAEFKVQCRNFAPAVGIQEEAATGTANGALTYYLKEHDLLKGNHMVAYQGQSLGRPSTIRCHINESKEGYVVRVGGKSKIIIEGVIHL